MSILNFTSPDQFVDFASIAPKEVREYNNYTIQNSVDDGFVRLYTHLGHRYWVAQAEQAHVPPDWKIHVSVALADIPKAWNTVASLFITRGCLSAMKSVNSDRLIEGAPSAPPPFMRGRELTIYIYRYDASYEKSCVYDGDAALSTKEEQDAEWWLAFVGAIEVALDREGVLPGETAVGDFPLGLFCSLRNEAFVDESRVLALDLDVRERDFYRRFGTARGKTYPPNALGWNAAQHPNPFQKLHTSSSNLAWTPWVVASLVIVLVGLSWRFFSELNR
eukprot:gnl/Spiro4/14233_TR7653_c0_g1_i1.p1 gnl/Spiro4/14233_TR7653_c0_g1~~gnl/Spiro4/14233_TR7653_c0_g1_i1.p1  ORF type:complete len:277 (-),score=40.55 gnl/Spiro4/14233_TR7653_c0_g1_i1:47-877(-)